MRTIYKSVFVLVGLVLAGAPPPVAAQALTRCTIGQQVIDTEGEIGVIVSDGSNLCQVKYPDGFIYGWIYWNLRSTGAPKINLPGPPDLSPAPSPSPNDAATPPILLRPKPLNTLVYRADPRGQITLNASVNGTQILFLVDTGASLVFLSAKDARAAGISYSELVFNQRAQTANGPVGIAPVLLREIRIEQVAVQAVPAAVIKNLDISVLGMSFLTRLKGFDMQNGSLTIKR
jgi:aspartyl protease family protein